MKLIHINKFKKRDGLARASPVENFSSPLKRETPRFTFLRETAYRRDTEQHVPSHVAKLFEPQTIWS